MKHNTLLIAIFALTICGGIIGYCIGKMQTTNNQKTVFKPDYYLNVDEDSYQVINPDNGKTVGNLNWGKNQQLDSLITFDNQ